MSSAPLAGAPDARAIRSALFVDFDNVYLTLHGADPRCAEVFATDPTGWVHWLERGMTPAAADAPQPIARRVLMRRCYLNPMSFRRYRADFIRAGFRVLDCPSLTRSGKSSTDIHMVMDIVDALQHPTPFDEFVIFSSDADFTPVLQRLREHDRRTVILAVGAAAAAYKASSDVVIDEVAFVEQALGLSPGPLLAAHEALQRQQAALADPELLQRMAGAVREAASQQGPLLATELPAVYKRFPEFAKSNWLGFFSLRALTEAVSALDPGLSITDGDPWRIEWRPLGADAADRVANAPTGSDLRAFMRHVQDVTGAPALLPGEHDAAFEALATALQEPQHDVVSCAKAAADLVIERGHAVPRSHLTFILQTLAQAGHDVASLRGRTPAMLARLYRDAIAAACDEAGLPLTDDELELLDRWILDGRVARDASIHAT